MKYTVGGWVYAELETDGLTPEAAIEQFREVHGVMPHCISSDDDEDFYKEILGGCEVCREPIFDDDDYLHDLEEGIRVHLPCDR